jgi:hypothetical protein
VHIGVHGRNAEYQVARTTKHALGHQQADELDRLDQQ